MAAVKRRMTRGSATERRLRVAMRSVATAAGEATVALKVAVEEFRAASEALTNIVEDLTSRREGRGGATW